MATKIIKSVGKSYLENCAKMCEYPVDLKNRFISIPQDELELTKDNLMVQHLVKQHGFFIQSTIPGSIEKTKVFDPEIRLMQKPIQKSEFSQGDEFEIQSTGCKLKISSREKDRITMNYTNRAKPDIVTNIDQLRMVLNRGAWKRI